MNLELKNYSSHMKNNSSYMPTPDEYLSSLDHGDAPAPLPSPRPPKQRRTAVTVLRVFLTIVLMVLIGALLYAGFIVNTVAHVSTKPWDLTPVKADATGRTNILVLGVGDPGHSGEKLSDTVMVVSLDRTTQRVAQISLPRDLRVSIPGYGKAKINAAHAVGGVPLSEEVTSQTLGIPIDYYVKTNFTGLKDLVDAVGGVDVDVKSRLYDPDYPCDDNQYKSCGLKIEPGLQHMDGTKALQYSRCRKGTCGNDYGRAARQQEIMGLVVAKMVEPSVLLHATQLKATTFALRNSLETDINARALIELGYDWRKFSENNPINLVLSTAQDGYLRNDPLGSSDLVPLGGDFSAIRSKVQSIFSSP